MILNLKVLFAFLNVYCTTPLQCVCLKKIAFLKSGLITNLENIYYFSDGSAAQFKTQKIFTNIYFHEKDFGIKAGWHSYATPQPMEKEFAMD